MDPRPSPHPPDPPSDRAGQPPSGRRDRQRTEILGLVAAQQLVRAADLAHEHLAEFPDDRSVRNAVAAALENAADPELRRRATELPP